MKRVLLVVLVILVVVIGAGAVFVASYRPSSRAVSPEPVASTPERVARGAYLVNHVVPCANCHTRGYGTDTAGPALAGGMCLDEASGFPGTLCVANVTPDSSTGIGAWTDREIMRAIREGVNNRSEALFPMMPYTDFRVLSEADAEAIVAYLRTVPAVHNPLPAKAINFQVGFFIKMVPKPLEGPVAEVPRADPVAYGRYLTTIAGCRFCHTPVNERMEPQADSLFAGGQPMETPRGDTVRSRNLTPDATGLGATTQDQFLALFHSWHDRDSLAPPLKDSPVPWVAFSGMADEDLSAIYAYLRSVPAVAHQVNPGPVTAP